MGGARWLTPCGAGAPLPRPLGTLEVAREVGLGGGQAPGVNPPENTPQDLVVGTRQGWAEAGTFAPPGGAGLRQRMILWPCPPPRRIPSAPGWEGHHRITTGSESEVNVKLGMSRVGHPSRTVGRRAQCGPCIWGGGVDVHGPLPQLTPKRTPIGASWRGQRRPRLQRVRGGHRPLQHPHPPYTCPGGTHIHPGFHPYTFRVFGGGRSRPLRSSLREFSVPRAYHPEKNPATPGGCGGR